MNSAAAWNANDGSDMMKNIAVKLRHFVSAEKCVVWGDIFTLD
jgi:hypothetical protein